MLYCKTISVVVVPRTYIQLENFKNTILLNNYFFIQRVTCKKIKLLSCTKVSISFATSSILCISLDYSIFTFVHLIFPLRIITFSTFSYYLFIYFISLPVDFKNCTLWFSRNVRIKSKMEIIWKWICFCFYFLNSLKTCIWIIMSFSKLHSPSFNNHLLFSYRGIIQVRVDC